MDSHLDIHADAKVPDRFLPIRESPASSPVLTDLFDASSSHNVSWFASKDCTFYHAKEEPISPIYQDSDSEETISSSESQRRSPQDNSFGSIARDASFIEIYTEVLDALTPPKVCDTACEIRRRDEYLGLLRTYICKVKNGAEEIELKAQRQVSFGSVYHITSSKGLQPAATIKQTAPGVFSIRTSEAHVTLTLRAKELNGRIYRLAAVQMPLCLLTSPGCKADPNPTSSRNFQLTLDSKVVFHLGKVASGSFALRFQQPLDPVLGFALAVCSLVQSNH
jgi:hypothetical protein